MGTTRGFIPLHNRGFSRPELEACLAGRPAPCGHEALLTRLTLRRDRPFFSCPWPEAAEPGRRRACGG